MCYGRALLLGIALASAVAAELACDRPDTASAAQLDTPDGGTDVPSTRPPGPVAIVVAPPPGRVRVPVTLGESVRAAPAAPDPSPLRVAPKTSPPALRA